MSLNRAAQIVCAALFAVSVFALAATAGDHGTERSRVVVTDDGAATAGDTASYNTSIPNGYFDGDRAEKAAEMLTTTNDGRVIGVTRWHQSTVTYNVDLPDGYPASLTSDVHEAYEWASTISGVEFVEVDGPADITVGGHDGDGGFGDIYRNGPVIESVKVGIGCCRRHVVWEEVLHSTGFISDRGPSESLASRAEPGDTPGQFDAVMLHLLYSELNPGDGPEQVQQQLRTLD